MMLFVKHIIATCILYFIIGVCNAQKAPENEPFEAFYESGALKVKGWYRNKKRVGVWKDFYESGVLKRLYSYKKGKINFISKRFFENGNLKSENINIEGKKYNRGYYMNGGLLYDKSFDAGYIKDFYENGNLKIERPIVNKQLSGICKHFYNTGEKEWEVSYFEGYKQGKYKQFYKNGQLKLEGEHELDIRQGEERHYLENGMLFLKGKYVKDKPRGKWMMYNEEGAIVETLKFSKGELVSKSNTSVEVISIPYGLVDQAPLHPKCKKMLGYNKQKKCLSEAINDHVASEFDTNLARKYGMSGRFKIKVSFRIDEYGEIVEIKARNPYKFLKDEAIRVIKLLPKMVPGQLRGENIDIAYSLPIIFQVKSVVSTTGN